MHGGCGIWRGCHCKSPASPCNILGIWVLWRIYLGDGVFRELWGDMTMLGRVGGGGLCVASRFIFNFKWMLLRTGDIFGLVGPGGLRASWRAGDLACVLNQLFLSWTWVVTYHHHHHLTLLNHEKKPR